MRAVVTLSAFASLVAFSSRVETTAFAQTADVRAFVGTGNGLGADLWVFEGRLRLDGVGAYGLGHMSWAGLALSVPLWSFAGGFLGARVGDQIEHLGQEGAYWSGSRFAQAPDVGLVLHVASARGHTLEAQAGGEAVFRARPAICCDNAALETRSFGVRILLRGELAWSPRWAVFGEAGLRTGDHVMEIRVFPSAAVGLRARF